MNHDERIRAMTTALEWYEMMAKQMGRATLQQDTQHMLFLMKEIAVDYGKRLGIIVRACTVWVNVW